MTLDGRRARVVPAHRAYAVAMMEDAPITEEQKKRLTSALTSFGLQRANSKSS